MDRSPPKCFYPTAPQSQIHNPNPRQPLHPHHIQATPNISYRPPHLQQVQYATQGPHQSTGTHPQMYGHGAVVNTVPGGIFIDQRRYGDPAQHRNSPTRGSTPLAHFPANGTARDIIPRTDQHMHTPPQSQRPLNLESQRRPLRMDGKDHKNSYASRPQSRARATTEKRPISVPISPVVQCLTKMWTSLEVLNEKMDSLSELGRRNAEELRGLREEVLQMKNVPVRPPLESSERASEQGADVADIDATVRDGGGSDGIENNKGEGITSRIDGNRIKERRQENRWYRGWDLHRRG